ncbi:hypothetical protein D9M70_477610 [compost metagenome]
MLPVFAEDLEEWDLHLGAGLFHRLERRGFVDVQADVQAHGDQQDAGQERHTPTPGEQFLAGQGGGDQQEDQVGQHGARRHAYLYPGAIEPSLVFGCMLHGHQDRATPLPTQRQALDDAQGQQRDRRPDTDGLIVWQQANAEGSRAHGQQRNQ